MPIQILDGLWSRSLITNAILNFFAGLDRICFSIFGWILQGIFDIANTNIISSDTFEEFKMRVYVILGIFMLFKVTISLLTYLVSPDKINDKERGLSKMVTRTIVVICMLAGLPTLFNLLDEAQPIVLEAVPRIIIGKEMTSSDDTVSSDVSEQMNSVSDTISWATFQIALNEETVSLMESDGINTVSGAAAVITEPASGDNSVYKYFYIPLVGSLVAIVMSFLLVGMGIDIAIRAFKLLILRMIAPIPVISYIDPKSAKDGAFNNWVKSLISTWTDLFMKLGILYFILYMLDIIVTDMATGGSGLGNLPFFRRIVVIIFLIIGLLFFARQAPKFISNALGIKNSKGFGVGLGGALAAGGALLGGGGALAALSAGVSAANENADAEAQGKAGTAGFTKGRDLAAQLRTGNKDAKGGFVNRLQQRARDSAGERRARNLGLSATAVDDLKSNMYAKEGALAQARDELTSYQARVDAGQAKYDQTKMEALQANIASANKDYGKAQSAYNDAKAARESIVRKNNTIDDYGGGRRGTYTARINAGSKGFERKPTRPSDVAVASKVDVPDDIVPQPQSTSTSSSYAGHDDAYQAMMEAQQAVNSERSQNTNSEPSAFSNNDGNMDG